MAGSVRILRYCELNWCVTGMTLSRTSLPDLAVLQAFEAAARHGSFTKAGVELNLTQSAISRQIRLLEEQLQVALFERVRKRVHLTTAGRTILPDVERLLAHSEELVFKARAATEVTGTLSIATLPTFGNRWLLPRLPHFLESHPGLMVDMASRSAPFDLQAENVDVAIHYGQPVWANATCTYLCSEVILPVAAPKLISSGAVADTADLAGQPLLHLTTRPKLWAEWFQANAVEHGNAYRGNRFDQFSMIIMAALQGMGVALLPSYLIEHELEAGTLNVVCDLPLYTDNSYYVVLADGRRHDPLPQAFQEWLLSRVDQKSVRA